MTWLPYHFSGMGLSYIILLTAYYVDNGPRLPVWDRLPHIVYWVLPAAVGVPLILRSLAATHVGATLDGSDLVTRSMSDHHDHDDRGDHPEGTWKIEGFDASP